MAMQQPKQPETVQPAEPASRESKPKPLSKAEAQRTSKQAVMQAALEHKRGKLDLRKFPQDMQNRIQRASKYFSEQSLAAMSVEPQDRPSPIQDRAAPRPGMNAKFT
jgi:hypothetical protein